jgi:hypothetical protein
MHPDEGTPQGGVISPLLANVYLHEVLDKWFVKVMRPQLRGPAHMVRYADDFVIVCAMEADAKRVMEALPERLTQYGLTMNTEKTRLVPFKRPKRTDERATSPGQPKPSFDLLGFTLTWRHGPKRASDGKRRGRVKVVERHPWYVGKETSSVRFTRALSRIGEWCKKHKHLKLKEQHEMLCKKVQGHYNYYGIWGNQRGISRFLWEVPKLWFYWLRRRAQRRRLTWKEFDKLLTKHPLPPARVTKGPGNSPKQTSRKRPLITKSRMRESCTSGSVGGPGAHLFLRWVPPPK